MSHLKLWPSPGILNTADVVVRCIYILLSLIEVEDVTTDLN
jgi:hypothetical protein